MRLPGWRAHWVPLGEGVARLSSSHACEVYFSQMCVCVLHSGKYVHLPMPKGKGRVRACTHACVCLVCVCVWSLLHASLPGRLTPPVCAVCIPGLRNSTHRVNILKSVYLGFHVSACCSSPWPVVCGWVLALAPCLESGPDIPLSSPQDLRADSSQAQGGGTQR